MRRDVNDIPEVFRRFLEEEGFSESDDGGDNGRRRPQRPFGRPWWLNRWFWLTVLFIVIMLSSRWIVTTYTEWLWFTALGYENVWLKEWGLQVASFAIFFVIAALILLPNWHLARRQALRTAGPPGRQLLQIPGLNWLLTAGALFLAYLFATAASDRWDTFLRYIYRVPHGLTDPIFERDISFYLFELPVYRFIQGWFIPLLLLALLGVVGLYMIANLPDVQRGRWEPQRLPTLRRHVALLGAVFLFVWAAGYVLNMAELNFAPGGVVFGATYTDLNATLPALWVQLGLMLLLALAVLTNFFRFDWRPVAAVGGLWLAATMLMGGIYPGLLQRYRVEPNELQLELPFIERNIAYTRMAYGLDRVDSRDFGAVTELDQQDLDANPAVLENVRLWDYRPLQMSYSQLQALRPYYQFGELDIDRYEIDGVQRQVMLGARELEKTQLPGQSWVNQKLEFTHGYGIVMNPVNRFTREGRPEFFIQDLPPRSSVDIEIDRPEIYYGELMSDIIFVNSGLEEFDYPSGSENVYSHYQGTGGVKLSSTLRRLAFAYRFAEINVLLSEYINSETQIMFHRQIRERARRIAPFLALDTDPYIVAADGRLVWMIDAYTRSNNFPYARPAPGGFNYIRNAVKLTIDAYDGDVNFYVADPDDPIIQTYARAFPDLFQPLEAMPESLQAHIRYPEDLFLVQTQQYLTYHMIDPQVFYNQEDLWEIPMEIFDTQQQPMEPYYFISSLPDQEETEYLLIQPYTPAGRNNMIAWLAGRSDPPHYGELVAYELPKQELIFGPIQVEGRIDQEPQISQQISLWSQRGSRVIRGNLLVIPMNGSFLYVEPLYLLSETSAIPELKRVIVASGDRIAMRETLTEALDALLLEGPAVDVIVTDIGDVPIDELPGTGTDDDTPDQPPAPTPIPGDRTLEELVNSANAHFEAAQAAQRNGDWATYGRELEALQQDLERLLELSGGSLE